MVFGKVLHFGKDFTQACNLSRFTASYLALFAKLFVIRIVPVRDFLAKKDLF